MKCYLAETVFCAIVSIAMASPLGASAGDTGTTWYNPFFTIDEKGEILDISLRNEEGEQVPVKTFVDRDERSYAVQVPTGVDLSALVPEIEMTEGFEIEPEPGTARDFSEPVTYTLRHPQSGQSFEWQVNVFDANSGMIFRGSDFKHWQLRVQGYDREEAFGKYLNNEDGLYFELPTELPDGISSLFYYENKKPVSEIKIKYDQLGDHHRNVDLQVLDLAPVSSDELADPKWSVTDTDKAEELVRRSQTLFETGGELILQANISDNPLAGPIAVQYGGAARDYRIHVKKVMLIFASD